MSCGTKKYQKLNLCPILSTSCKCKSIDKSCFWIPEEPGGRTQTNNAQLYVAEHYFKWLSHEKLLSAGDC